MGTDCLGRGTVMMVWCNRCETGLAWVVVLNLFVVEGKWNVSERGMLLGFRRCE